MELIKVRNLIVSYRNYENAYSLTDENKLSIFPWRGNNYRKGISTNSNCLSNLNNKKPLKYSQ